MNAPLLVASFLLLSPACRAEVATWDGRAGQGRSGVMPVFAAPPLGDAKLLAEAEAFLADLYLTRDDNAAFARISTLANPIHLDQGDWKFLFGMMSQDGPKASSLEQLYEPLSPEASFAAFVSRSMGGGRVERLGPRFLVARPSRAADFEWMSLASGHASAEPFLRLASRLGVELRLVLAGHRHDPENFYLTPEDKYFDVFLWAREETGWKVWMLGHVYHRAPK